MANFEYAIKLVLKHEGGYVNHHQDPGGATNYGVSLRYLQSIGEGDFDFDGDIDADDIKKMTVDDAKKLYWKYWWLPNKYDLIAYNDVAAKIFDLAVNMGSKQAHKIVQRSVRSASGEILVEDGILGIKSLQAINICESKALLPAIRSESAGFYRSLNKPAFINGWLNRAYA